MLLDGDERHGDIFVLHAFGRSGRHTKDWVDEQARFTGDARMIQDDRGSQPPGSQYNQVGREEMVRPAIFRPHAGRLPALDHHALHMTVGDHLRTFLLGSFHRIRTQVGGYIQAAEALAQFYPGKAQQLCSAASADHSCQVMRHDHIVAFLNIRQLIRVVIDESIRMDGGFSW